MKLSELKTLDQVIEEQRQDPEFRREWDRTEYARQVAIRIIQYRQQRNLTQTALARRVGTTQSVIARLEGGDSPPSLSTLAKLSAATGLEFHLDVVGGSVELASA